MGFSLFLFSVGFFFPSPVSHFFFIFCSPASFEFTREVQLFDLFRVPLVHGWLVDPQEVAVAAAVGDRSFNQLQNTAAVAAATPLSPTIATNSAIVEYWLQETQSQLTYYGLAELFTHLKVLFV